MSMVGIVGVIGVIFSKQISLFIFGYSNLILNYKDAKLFKIANITDRIDVEFSIIF